MNLPEGSHFAYIIPHEAYYRDVVANSQPSIYIMAAANEGGVMWEFDVEEHRFGGKTVLFLRMFDESWVAFIQIPEFFTMLREQRPTSLVKLRVLLNELGAKDNTQRQRR